MSLSIEKGYRISSTEPQLLRLEFNPSEAQPQWKIIRSRRPWREESRLVTRLASGGMSERAISKKLNISLALVKKRKRQMRDLPKGSGGRPGTEPKGEPRGPVV